jgi:hypothetical protein
MYLIGEGKRIPNPKTQELIACLLINEMSTRLARFQIRLVEQAKGCDDRVVALCAQFTPRVRAAEWNGPRAGESG